MAIFRPSNSIAAISGTMAGMNFTHSWRGAIVRTPRKFSNAITQDQAAQRALWVRFNSLWRSLSQAQRNAWDTFAALPNQTRHNRLGYARYYSGYQWFLRCNCRRAIASQSPVTTPPTAEHPISVDAPTLSPTFHASGTCYINCTPNQFGLTESLIVFGQFSRTTNTTKPTPNQRIVYALFDPPNGPIDIYDLCVHFFGLPPLGVTMSATFHRQSPTGKRSAGETIRATVT